MDLQPKRFTRCKLPAMRMTQEDPCTCLEAAIFSAISSLPAPYTRAGCMAFSSYPYRFVPGQPGQPGQTPETIANRSSYKFIMNIFAGTQPGHAGTLRYQDVADRANGHTLGHGNLSRIAAGAVLSRCFLAAHSPGHLSRPGSWSGSLGRGLKHSQRRSKSGAGA